MRMLAGYVRRSITALCFAVLVTLLTVSGFVSISGQPANAQTNPTTPPIFIELTPVGSTTSPGRVTFAENKGQLLHEFYYITWGNQYEAKLTKQGILFTIEQPYDYIAKAHELRATIDAAYSGQFATANPRTPQPTPIVIKYDEFQLQFAGINPNAVFVPEDQKEQTLAYYMPTVTATDVHTYGQVRYSGAYQGIDIVYYANDKWVHYDFHLAPQADPNQIKINLVGINSLRLDLDGALIANFGEQSREIRQAMPFAYQVLADMQQTQIEVRYKVDGQSFQFELGDYDKNLPLYLIPFYTADRIPTNQ